MELPDYHGGSIVNLMRSIERALDARPCDEAQAYPELNALPAQALAGTRNIVLLDPGGAALSDRGRARRCERGGDVRAADRGRGLK
jgi:hypothetical protein